ncbi:NAD(P)H-dependent oxidoreductase [Ideonella sp.]|uniref:glutathione-regulated potassium-efflux system oxidoreductase KefF n=1 Tax=Ideonella sp. TaxID=1929293 RepID=UPI002B4821D7|nr:NAD(P)H-dependent oxidoreductase [Ideonella sp.]HJV69288.1 NAD(P)H-dependent oxidoreductase [Ideonella sp.]
MALPEIVVLVAHPRIEHSRVNRRLMQAAEGLPAGRVAVRDLYRLYPDYLIDVEAERTALAAARLLVWQFPFHWYGPPPMLKLWLDEVFGFGWAYGPGGTALRGKDLWLAVSTGGGEQAYHPSGHNRHFIDAFWPPIEQTAVLAGMRFLPPLVLHAAHRVSDDEVAGHAALYADRLAAYPNWPELAELEVDTSCFVPATDRPQD